MRNVYVIALLFAEKWFVFRKGIFVSRIISWLKQES